MNRVLKFLGAAFLAIVILIAVMISFTAVKSQRVARDSKGFVDTSIVAIITNWNVTELENRATPDLVNDLSSPNGQNLFPFLARLGQLTKYNGSTYQGYSASAASGQSSKITAWYSASAEFTHGAAKITINIVKQDGQWRIYGFHVDSPSLITRTSSSTL